MATHGSMKAFNAQVDDWSIYVERLQHYLIANDVTDAGKKRSILLTVCGTPTYKLLRSLVKDGNLDTTSYDDLVKLLKDHYNLKTSVIVRRFHFNTRTRTSGESIVSYVAALRELALHCEYGDKLAEMLRDRLVCGVNHKGIQRKLLAEADLTYDRAYSLAQMVEASERDSKKLEKPQGQDTPLTATSEHELHYSCSGMSQRSQPARSAGHIKGPTVSCYRCGGAHLAPQCRHKNVICHSCKKRGHLARVWKSKPQQGTQNRTQPQEQDKSKKSTHYMEQSTSEDVEYNLFTLSNKSPEPYRVDVFLNDVLVEMELDTGASVSVINDATYRNIQQQTFVTPLQPTESKLRSYTGEHIKVLGTTQFKVRYRDKELCLSVHVVNAGGPNLMGRDWLAHFEVNLSSLNVLEQHSTPLKEVLDKHAAMFADKVGCLNIHL